MPQIVKSPHIKHEVISKDGEVTVKLEITLNINLENSVVQTESKIEKTIEIKKREMEPLLPDFSGSPVEIVPYND